MVSMKRIKEFIYRESKDDAQLAIRDWKDLAFKYGKKSDINTYSRFTIAYQAYYGEWYLG